MGRGGTHLAVAFPGLGAERSQVHPVSPISWNASHASRRPETWVPLTWVILTQILGAELQPVASLSACLGRGGSLFSLSWGLPGFFFCPALPPQPNQPTPSRHLLRTTATTSTLAASTCSGRGPRSPTGARASSSRRSASTSRRSRRLLPPYRPTQVSRRALRRRHLTAGPGRPAHRGRVGGRSRTAALKTSLCLAPKLCSLLLPNRCWRQARPRPASIPQSAKRFSRTTNRFQPEICLMPPPWS